MLRVNSHALRPVPPKVYSMNLIDLDQFDVASLDIVDHPAELLRVVTLQKSQGSFGDKFVIVRLSERSESGLVGRLEPWRETIRKSESKKSRAGADWDESKVVRDDIGRFAEKGVQQAAAKDAAKAAVLMSKVTRPEERAKLESNLLGMGMSESELDKARNGADSVAGSGQPAETAPVDASSSLADKIKQDGGFTHQPGTGASPTKGYSIAVFPDKEKIMPIDEVSPAALFDYMESNAADFDADDRIHFGAWFNEKNEGNPDGDDQVYLDMSMVIEDRDEAIKMAKQYGQLGIYDLEAGETVQTMTPDERAAWEASQGTGDESSEPDDATTDSGSGDTVALEGGLGIARKDLPQVKSDDMAELHSWLRERGVSVETEPVDPGSLKPVQAHISQSKVDGMRGAQEAGTLDVTKKPIMVSSDDYLIDGHHRWAVARDMNLPMQGTRVGLPAEELLARMDEFPKSFKEGIEVNRGRGLYKSFAPEAAKRFNVVDEMGHNTLHRYALNPETPDEPNWQADRQEMHKELIAGIIGTATPVPEGVKPIGFIAGGGSAAGKSSILKSGLVQLPESLVWVDSDEIKGKLPEYAEMVGTGDKVQLNKAAAFAHEESSYLSKKVLSQSIGGRMNTLLDGTGNNRYESLKRKVDKMREGGMEVQAQYVTVDTDEAVRRSMERAAKTGREVPESMIRKTHKGVSAVLPRAAKEGLFDKWQLWDTGTGGEPLMVAEGEGANGRVADREAWGRFLKKADEETFETYKDLFSESA